MVANPQSSHRANLRAIVFGEPSTSENRWALVELVRDYVDVARGLSEAERQSGRGAGIAADITGAIGFQGATGVSGDDWVTEHGEPELFTLLQLAGHLEIFPETAESWDELFRIASSLR